MKIIPSYILTLAFLLMELTLKGQSKSSIEPLVTDRPDQTEASRTIPAGSFQIETGVIKEETTEDGIGEEKILYPTTVLRISILENFELRIIDQFNYSRITQFDGSEKVSYGIENLAIGVKINVCTEKGWRPETAFLSHLTLPLASSFYKNERVLADFKISFSHNITSGWDWGWNLGWKEEDQIQLGIGTYSFEVSYKISTKMSSYLEIYGEAPDFKRNDSSLDAGLSFLFYPNFKLDAAYSKGISMNSSYVNFGFSWRLPQ